MKAVLWNVYGTLLAIPTGDLVFEHPQPLIMEVALDKTIAEFNMWASMSRKPGKPAVYLQHLYSQELLQHKSSVGSERFARRNRNATSSSRARPCALNSRGHQSFEGKSFRESDSFSK